MKKKGIFDHWILSEVGLNENTLYHSHPPGNSPELNLLDCTLFKDLDDRLNQHILMTHNLPDNDPKKFSLSTPRRLMRSYQRVWDVCPSSNRIVQDITKCLMINPGEIRRHGGVVAPELGNRVGKRNANSVTKSTNWGGKRIKRKVDFKAVPLHEDACEQRTLILKSFIAVKEEQKMKSIKNDDDSESDDF